jgi:hypothetical protein
VSVAPQQRPAMAITAAGPITMRSVTTYCSDGPLGHSAPAFDTGRPIPGQRAVFICISLRKGRSAGLSAKRAMVTALSLCSQGSLLGLKWSTGAFLEGRGLTMNVKAGTERHSAWHGDPNCRPSTPPLSVG